MNKINSSRIRNLYLPVILAGMACTLIPQLHHSLWFDEAYTIGMISHSFSDIISIGIHDVHPLLYYFLLKVFTAPFSDKILACRIFSWIMLCLTGLLGAGIIRKKYGEKTGLLFSFLVFFYPLNIVYAGEIRMYTMVLFLTTVASVHGASLMNEWRWKDGILFSLFCILSAYTHYYGLMAAAVMNLLLLFHFIHKRSGIRQWLIIAGIQIVSYLPWLPVLYRQTTSVKSSFWIEWKWPQSLVEILRFLFSGSLDDFKPVPDWLILLFAVIFAVSVLAGVMKNKNSRGFFCFSTCAGVLLVSALASILLHRDIFYPRYLLVIHGCFLLGCALNLTALSRKQLYLPFSACLIMVLLIGEQLCRNNYDAGNQAVVRAFEKNMQKQDTVIISNTGQNPSSFAFFMQTEEQDAVYWNRCRWNEESIAAYRAFGNLQVVEQTEDISRLHGRIWLIFCSDDKRRNAQYLDVNDLNEIFHSAPVRSWHMNGKYKGFTYAAYLYEVN